MYYHESFTAIRDAALAKITRALPEVFYLLVGANDGQRGDPLVNHTAHPKWRGMLFEPLPGPFAALKATYAGRPGAELRNEAVVADAPGGKRTFYAVPGSTTNSSFRRDVIERQHGGLVSEGVDPRIEPVEVECRAVAELEALPGFRVPDVLLTDTEGYDFMLFEAWWARGWRPPFVEVEVIHLSLPEKTRIREELTAAGYYAMHYHTDLIGLRRDFFLEEDLAVYRALSDQALAALGMMNMIGELQAKLAGQSQRTSNRLT